jgi:hypothetical protein
MWEVVIPSNDNRGAQRLIEDIVHGADEQASVS